MNESVVLEFHRKLTYEKVNDNFIHEKELKKSYWHILESMATDYAEYRKHVPKVLSSLETNNPHSVAYSINLFFELYEQLIAYRKFRAFDLSVMEHDANDQTLEKMKPVFESSLSKNNKQRMSEENFDISSLSENDKKEMASLIINKLQNDSKKLNWNKEMVEVTLMQFVFLRQILVSLGNAELFYHAVGIFFDRLSSSEYYQAGRDIAEEVIISSYKNGLPELGYFNSFRLYSNIGSVHASLLYANLSMICILQKKPPYSDKFVKEIIWQGIKLFRNVHLMLWVTKIYNAIPVELKFLDYERRSLDHTYFTSLLTIKEATLPALLLDYLNKEREEVISGGINEALPWLLTLYNIKRIYPVADFSATGLGFYLSVFESIVPTATVKKYRDIIDGNSGDLKGHLKESLVKLNETRNRTDFVYDNESAIRISSRLIEYSVSSNDVAAFLLSMMLKSDYSILFQPKESLELAPLILPEINIDSLETLYENQPAFLEVLPFGENYSVIWLGFSEGKIFQLHLINGEYSLSPLAHWSYDTFKGLINSDYFFELTFSESVKDKSGVRLILPEEFKHEEKEVANKLSFGKLAISPKSESVYFVKDMELSKYPHNLFLDENGNFIAKRIPVTNVLSTEWLIQTAGIKPLEKDYSKSIWIPIESGDFTLNYLCNNIEKTLQECSFEIHKEVELANPLASDINIICSHGARNISEVQIVFQENNPTYNLNSIIGRGRILIFFVCYSGSMKTEFFRNNITSMVKRFIANGYDAVIAPFWALDVTIPKYWLPEFLDSINKGLPIELSVFNANKKVNEVYPTPAAWACLHLYGNPHIKINIK
ncbi:MAG: hypothetical protein HYY40_00150 [Bacteroidetes bacterium]|nr:hypothetical protein [Bacteroidota bacterium]